MIADLLSASGASTDCGVPAQHHLVIPPARWSYQQQRSTVDQRRYRDCYLRRMVKYQGIGEFHSRAELYFAALCEGDPRIPRYVPHPVTVKVSRRRIAPDFIVEAQGQALAVTLEPPKGLDAEQRVQLERYAQRQFAQCVVIDRAQLLERAVEAENWLTIIALLVTCSEVDTRRVEDVIFDEFYRHPRQLLGDLVDSGARANSLLTEVALFRLLHQGRLTANLDTAALDYGTELAWTF